MRKNKYAEQDAMVERVDGALWSVNLKDRIAIEHADRLTHAAQQQYARALLAQARPFMEPSAHATVTRKTFDALDASERAMAQLYLEAEVADRKRKTP